MNVLFVLEHYHPYIGGAEKLFKLLAESLVNRGFSVKVITTLYKDSLPQKEEINGVQIIRVRSKNRYSFTLFSLGVIFKYRRWPNLIHTTTYNAAIPSSIVGFMCQIPVTITVHEIWGKLWYKMPMLTLYERILYSLFESIVLKFPFNKYIGVSDYTYNSLIQRLPADKCVKILNGFPNKEKCNQATHNSSNIPEWLFYGRLGASKGIGDFNRITGRGNVGVGRRPGDVGTHLAVVGLVTEREPSRKGPRREFPLGRGRGGSHLVGGETHQGSGIVVSDKTGA